MVGRDGPGAARHPAARAAAHSRALELGGSSRGRRRAQVARERDGRPDRGRAAAARAGARAPGQSVAGVESARLAGRPPPPAQFGAEWSVREESARVLGALAARADSLRGPSERSDRA